MASTCMASLRSLGSILIKNGLSKICTMEVMEISLKETILVKGNHSSMDIKKMSCASNSTYLVLSTMCSILRLVMLALFKYPSREGFSISPLGQPTFQGDTLYTFISPDYSLFRNRIKRVLSILRYIKYWQIFWSLSLKVFIILPSTIYEFDGRFWRKLFFWFH